MSLPDIGWNWLVFTCDDCHSVRYVGNDGRNTFNASVVICCAEPLGQGKSHY